MEYPRPSYTGRGGRPDRRALTIEAAAAHRRAQQHCPERLDIHQWAANEINKPGEDGASSQPYFVSAAKEALETGIPASIGFEPYSFYFDSINRDGGSDLRNGLLGFTIGGLNTGQPIANVVRIKLSPFFFPRLVLPATSPDFFFFNRVYISLVTPFPANQAVMAANGRRYHFECEVSNLGGTAVILTPLNPEVFFRVPITSMSSIQFLFMTAPYFTPIPLPQDIIQVTAIPGTNPGQFAITDPGVTTAAIGPLGPLPAPGVAVYINNFVSGTAFDPLINNPGGFFVTNNLSLTVFETNLNFAALPVPVPPVTYLCTMIVAKNRIAMQLEATCAADHLTNYVNLIQV